MDEKLKPKLLPCPFCGGCNLIIQWWPIIFYVFCTDCTARGGGGSTKKEAIEEWNRRADNG